MNTPTPSKPQSHEVKQEMTPGSFANHLAFSPQPPRSIASPALFSKKSPANAASMHHHNTGSSNPGLLNFDSPSAAAALGMISNMPGLDAGTSGNARENEEERKRRIEAILGLLKKKPGRVSEDGIERLAQRTGMEFFWAGEPGKRTFTLGGSSMLIEIEFANNIVHRVSLSFPEIKGPITTFAPAATEILRRDLTPPPGVSHITFCLSRFWDNFERLTRLDKLSVLPGVSCFEAVSGVYTSLRRIFEYEKKLLRESRNGTGMKSGNMRAEEALEREVMCRKSGLPRMHAAGRVGVRLDYWMERRHIGLGRNVRPVVEDSEAREDIGDLGSGLQHGLDEDDEPQIWSAVIECESSPADLYPSIRVSDSWVSERIVKSQDSQVDDVFALPTEPSIDWLEPVPTFLPQVESMDVDNAPGSLAKLPNVRFVARLEPPVVLPLAAAMSIYNSTGVEIPQHLIQPTLYDELLLTVEPPEVARSPGLSRELSRERVLFVPDGEGNMIERRHRYNLYFEKREYGRVVEEIPFSHPKQLLAILPILRQHALASTLLRSTSCDLTTKSPATPSTITPKLLSTKPSAESALDALLSDVSIDGSSTSTLNVDVRLSADPDPHFTVVFPHHKKGALATITTDIFQQGDVHVSGPDFKFKEKGKDEDVGVKLKRVSDPQMMGRALEISEDLGLWVSWIEKGLDEG